MSRMEIRCFGPSGVVLDGRPVRTWRAGKARSLFHYLLLHRGRWVPRDRLQEVLWPGGDPRRTGVALRVAMHAVRQVLTGQTRFGVDPPVRVVHAVGGYRLDADDVWSDVGEFEDVAGAARGAARAGDEAGAAVAHGRLVELHRGEFLAEDDAEWVLAQREYCRDVVLHALTELTRRALRSEDVLGVFELSRRILDVDPYQESGYRALMTVHGRLGEIGRVHHWYALCARRLRSGLGVEPGEETRRVLDQVLRGAPPFDGPSTSAAA